MFNFRSKSSEEEVGKKSSEPSLSIVAKGTTMVGDVVSDGDIRVEGHIYGRLICKSKLVVGTNGKIEGIVDTKNATVAGEIKGTIVVREVLQLQETAKLFGDVCTAKLMVQQGAVFTGNCKMGIEATELLKRTPIPDLLSNPKPVVESHLNLHGWSESNGKGGYSGFDANGDKDEILIRDLSDSNGFRSPDNRKKIVKN